ncbi:MAG: primosomal protein N' [Gammaproteobacteria bacterium]|nr:primosomal protein N' [Gammaproteobacteria bacterium]
MPELPAQPVLRLAIPAPVYGLFDYHPPADVDAAGLCPGIRVEVMFGRSRRVGLLVEVAAASELPVERLRAARRIIDAEPVLPADLLTLLRWAADYYRQPPGEMFWSMLPAGLRRGDAIDAQVPLLALTPAGASQSLDSLRRAPRQAALLAELQQRTPLPIPTLDDAQRRAAGALCARGWASRTSGVPDHAEPAAWPNPAQGPSLTPEQSAAVDRISAGTGFAVHLLHGVTGSGKTEVYMRLMAQQVAAGRQSLVLVPEIGLTPQLIERFRARFGEAVAVLHSGLGDAQRLAAWRDARSGQAAIVVGTRSALFVPLARPGLMILDEEHDASFRQTDGVRYSARDLAVVRARSLGIGLVLGSGTPSLESLKAALEGRYGRVAMPTRVGGGREPALKLVDIDQHAQQHGLSTPLLAAMHRHLAADGQVLLFLNRRGFAPALWCTSCGHIVECHRCDARMTVHQADNRLRCHHCGAERAMPASCSACGAAELAPVGQGTERIEEVLGRLFPGVPGARIDRDTTRRRHTLEAQLEAVRSGEVRILVGTQMLAKGHDFPGITLVGVLDADQGLFSSDFRASERLAQTIVQVAGRCGRGDQPGEVLIQTRFPQHPLLQQLCRDGYAGFATALLAERQAAGWPPFTRLALLRAEAANRQAPRRFLEAARDLATGMGVSGTHVLGPAPAGMERRAGRYRQQLLFQADDHRPLQRLLAQLPGRLSQLTGARDVRWVLDVDPVDLI